MEKLIISNIGHMTKKEQVLQVLILDIHIEYLVMKHYMLSMILKNYKKSDLIF